MAPGRTAVALLRLGRFLIRGKSLTGYKGVEDVRVEVGAAGPTDGSQLRVHADREELISVAQRREHPGKWHELGQIDHSFGAVFNRSLSR